MSELSHEELYELKARLEELEKRQAVSGIAKWFVPDSKYSIDKYPKHRTFFHLGSECRERVFLASNRSGKSTAGAYEVACHLTGKYPDWWTGRRFDKAVEVWVAGKDKTTTRDTIQRALFGPASDPGTGMIPAEDIERTWSMQAVPNGIELAKVKHISGKSSVIGFKSYDRGVDSFFGTAMDIIWLDEECPEEVYGECLLRTMTTNGLMLVTFTPKKGLTPLVLNLCKKSRFVDSERFIEPDTTEESVGRAVVMAGWDDVPHLDEQAKKDILEVTPVYLRDAVSKGIPTFGEGSVYPMSRTDIECDNIEIPPHWQRWYGMDVGWNCTAACFFARDPDSGQIYITDVYRGERAEPIIHAKAISTKAQEWMAGAIDPGSRQRNQRDGSQLMNIYRDLGLNVIIANNNVDAGIGTVWELLSTGRLKVFKTAFAFFSEFMTYVFKNGRIDKSNDHIMDAMRYGIMTMDKVAKVKPASATTQGASYGSRRFNF